MRLKINHIHILKRLACDLILNQPNAPVSVPQLDISIFKNVRFVFLLIQLELIWGLIINCFHWYCIKCFSKSDSSKVESLIILHTIYSQSTMHGVYRNKYHIVSGIQQNALDAFHLNHHKDHSIHPTIRSDGFYPIVKLIFHFSLTNFLIH